MEKTFQIGEIARFFDLAPSTLRYWEECGILAPDKNKENQYRTYSVSDLMAISDAVFYKSLGLPLKQIRDMEQTTPGQHRELLEEKMGELVALQEQVQLRMEKLRFHLAAIDEVERLRKRPYAIEDIDTECIVSFDLIEQDKLRQYIGNPYLYSRVQHSCCLQQEHRGLTVPAEQLDQFPPEQILWQDRGGTYAACLMREEHTQPYKNNLQQQLAHIQKSYRTGAVISRFLLCAREDGELYDFYKTFVEVFPCGDGLFLAPMISWGKAELDGGRMRMPLPFEIHHGAADGFHIARFYDEVEQEAAALAEYLLAFGGKSVCC